MKTFYVNSYNIKIILILSLLVVFTNLKAQSTIKLEEAKIIAALTHNYGERAGKRGKAWFRLIKESTKLDDKSKLERVNSFFNLLHFTRDIKLWGVSNYWATPLEFLGANGGDCEEFAIAKYFTLLELGVPDNKLRIAMVKSVTLKEYHMVLAYYPKPTSVPVILDNIVGQIKPATSRQDLIPVYSFNGKQLWLNKQRNQGVLAGKSERLSLWADLNKRMGVSKMKKPKFRME